MSAPKGGSPLCSSPDYQCKDGRTSADSSPAPGNDRYIVDYLVDEVLQRQPDHVRTFLLTTSVLERLSGSLCDAVTERHDSKAMLETLEHGNLFVVPLDDIREWYRYHRLFADVLQAHLLESRPDDIAAVYWCLPAGATGQTVRSLWRAAPARKLWPPAPGRSL